MLFFSGALFIILAIGVHLTPYFPSVSDFVTSVQSIVLFDNREDSCINLVNELVWDVKPSRSLVQRNTSSNSNSKNGAMIYDKIWDWTKTGKVKACEFQRLDSYDASDVLNGSWVIVAGDSQAWHNDYKIVIEDIGMKLYFIWPPYMVNLTDLMTGFMQNRSYPDVLVMGAGLWHMLHVTNVSDYGVALQSLRSSVLSFLPFSPQLGTDGPVTGYVSVRSPHLFWLGMPMLINGILKTEEKREKMSDEIYGGPLLLLDIQSMSWNCGPRCNVDGTHYDGAVYKAVVHILLNALLIESRSLEQRSVKFLLECATHIWKT
ncbi:hypothetical protein P3X46_013872 [Hevea brasiliensis]|uniref:Sialate O-acetylesterase domain-containing protein n=1 Tax=Hevea brasiliensis TaxID=3981 RepID=A0ABQ9M6Y3_HEVBR|nr:hypothetical protein P3X46_013872 [Hevea brasiliensis]